MNSNKIYTKIIIPFLVFTYPQKGSLYIDVLIHNLLNRDIEPLSNLLWKTKYIKLFEAKNLGALIMNRIIFNYKSRAFFLIIIIIIIFIKIIRFSHINNDKFIILW